jgi:hypothetical protein
MLDQNEQPAASPQKISSAPPSALAQNRNTILMGLGAAVALSVPASIHEIGSPLTRTIVSLVALVVVFGLGYFVTPGKK